MSTYVLVHQARGHEVFTPAWGPSPFMPSYERAKAKGWKTVTIPCGPDVMRDMPEQLTGELLAAAPQSTAAAG